MCFGKSGSGTGGQAPRTAAPQTATAPRTAAAPQPIAPRGAPKPSPRAGKIGKGAQQPLQIGPPTEATIHIPRNRLDAHGVPVQLTSYDIDRQSLESALSSMAQYLNQKRVHLIAVTVGGAVNCLYLRSRQTTHDVDIFGSNLDTPARILLDQAMQYAIQQFEGRLGTDWFNTENQMWMGPNTQKELTELAMRQGAVVFEEPGLRLLAAPWDQVRSYDLDDAVSYLAQLVRRNGDRPIALGIVERWSSRFSHTTSRDFLVNRVDQEYRKRFGKPGIVQVEGSSRGGNNLRGGRNTRGSGRLRT
ncbi:hypothetical protein BU16DRAFT_615284 [Lophium mytilinum]|uniref:DUF7582 domain-containing protein n=1 Tax=Lophium mytilinum TaxID=390894 RepID=A0A6A6R1T0_9PEZI|nr:hypothetical protein BU16DRAFT_615284 [Lophium mytilinum]